MVGGRANRDGEGVNRLFAQFRLRLVAEATPGARAVQQIQAAVETAIADLDDSSSMYCRTE